MNPCIDCSLDKMNCHESGFDNIKCDLWQEWVEELQAWRPDIFKKEVIA